MLICGVKLTHDGGVALIRDGELIACHEMEKLQNNRRFTDIEDTAVIPTIIDRMGVDWRSIDCYAVDGWGGYGPAMAGPPRLELGATHNLLSARSGAKKFVLPMAQYEERKLGDDLLEARRFSGLEIRDEKLDYYGFLHVADHVMSAYCTSPFAARYEGAHVLVWDGGMYPRLYYFDPARGAENLGPLFYLFGNVYTVFSQHFSIFKVHEGIAYDNLSLAGKIMAFIAKGTMRDELVRLMERIYRESCDHSRGFANTFAQRVRVEVSPDRYSDEDILASFHQFIERMLVAELEKKMALKARVSRNLCIVGGCGLNIKWNAAIRASHLFDEVHVPPFPNDSGSAIGAACSAMWREVGASAIGWNVYSGPEIVRNAPAAGWTARDCNLASLASLLHERGVPVTFLNGRAELGPRALGNRSILASAASPAMKDLLNEIKHREDYRPVSPICLEHRAREIFDPGTPDPWMLFEHMVRPSWLDRIPAVVHLDGTARLQTVSARENPVVSQLLEEYARISSIPVLCNTSANYEGCGFFPDVRSATAWGGTRHVWCDGVLYEGPPD